MNKRYLMIILAAIVSASLLLAHVAIAKDDSKVKRHRSYRYDDKYIPYGEEPGFTDEDEFFSEDRLPNFVRKFMRGVPGRERGMGSRFSEGKVDIKEKGKMVYVKVELPGMTKKSIKLSVNESLLTISAKQQKYEHFEDKDKGEKSTKTEKSSYSQRIRLPSAVDHKSAKANYKDGILIIELKKVKGRDEHLIPIN